MKRVFFVACAALLVLASSMSVDAKKKEICFQMYSVRDLIGDPGKYAQNHEKVLKQLADMGYTAVEAANYGDGKLYGVSPEQFKADIEAAGLKVMSSHVTRNLNDDELKSKDFADALRWWDECIDVHKRAGMQYMVIPWCSVPKTLAELQTVCDYYNEVGKKVAAAGMKLGYHNHSHEFQKVEGKVMEDYMIEHTDPKYLFFQMDVYWTVRGQVSPVDYFNKYPGRFALLHIKDNCEIGQSGMVGFDAIFNNFDKAGAEGWVLELEHGSTPNILDGMRESAEYIKKAKFVKASYNK
ncbi:MAG: sugar phosphate isomerase/epimerase family protein [Bacteroidaceae bacterium]